MKVPLIPVIDITPGEQAEELAQYLSELDSSCKVKVKESDDLNASVPKILDVLPKVIPKLHMQGPIIIEYVLNGAISLLYSLPMGNDKNAAHLRLARVITESHKNTNMSLSTAAMKLLVTILQCSSFCGGETVVKVYRLIISWSTEYNLLTIAPIQTKQVGSWVSEFQMPAQHSTAMWRLAVEAWRACGNDKETAAAFKELLAAHEDGSSAEARDDAISCLVHNFNEPSTFLFDALLPLKPIAALEGEPLHELLTIFVTKTLPDYQKWAAKHAALITDLGLNVKTLEQKLKLLTLLQMTEVKQLLTFDEIQAELQLQPEEVEQFIIGIVRAKVGKVRINQLERSVQFTAVLRRSFTNQHWKLLKDRLDAWHTNLAQIHNKVSALHTA